MSYLPELAQIKFKKSTISRFGGLNRLCSLKDSEFSEMTNMSSRFYPALSPRMPRHKVRTLTKPNGLFMHGRLCWVDGTSFYYNGTAKGTVSDSPKTLLGMGAYIAIFPDKLLYNTETDAFERMENSVTVSGVSYALCDCDGNAYTYVTSEPASPANGDYWLDTSASPFTLKQFSSAQGEWVAVSTVYVKLSAEGIGQGFNALDAVNISGLSDAALNGDFIINARSADYIVITAIIASPGTSSGEALIKRSVPELDYVVQSSNRLWGCSDSAHAIYASKQGDAKNWYCYAGIASDSYAVTVGSAGNFTGAAVSMGNVLFFKEDRIIRVYGSKPSNYQLSEISARGVEAGSARSAVMLDEVLYYRSKSDICRSSGGIPESVSSALGDTHLKNAVGGALGSKYYISGENGGKWELLVFDSSLNLWHREDSSHVLFFASGGNELYFLTSEGSLYNINGSTDYDSSPSEEPPVCWECVTAPVGADSPDSKYVSKLRFRFDAESHSSVSVAASYDGKPFTPLFTVNSSEKRSVTVPALPLRCDTMRFKFSGRGSCRVYSVTRYVEQGSDL